MDIATVVAWTQAVIWIVAVARNLTKPRRQGTTMWRTDKVLTGLVCFGLLMSGISLYLNYTSIRIPTPDQWEKYRGSLEVIRNKTFTNQEIDLDGKDIENCTLISTTLIYRGKRPFIFANDSMDLSHHPLEIKIVDGPAMSGAVLIGGLLNELCKEKAKEGMPCPGLPVNLHGVDEQLTMH